MKKINIWLAAKGADVLAYAAIVLACLIVLYLLALGSILLVRLGNMYAMAAAVVVVGIVIGGAVAAIQWIVTRE